MHYETWKKQRDKSLAELTAALNKWRDSTYKAEAVAERPDQLANEAIGLFVVRSTDSYDGEQAAAVLLTALYAALEDCNWHTEARIVCEWVERMESGEMLHSIIRNPQAPPAKPENDMEHWLELVQPAFD